MLLYGSLLICFLVHFNVSAGNMLHMILVTIAGGRSGGNLSGNSNYAIWAEVIKLFSSLAQLSIKLQLLLNVEIAEISGKFRFSSQQLVIYPAHKC